MNDAMCLIASCVLNSLWEVAVIGGAGWMASLLLRRLGPRVEHRAWVATLVLAVVTPVLPLGRALLPLLQRQSSAVGSGAGGVFAVGQTGEAQVVSGSILLPQWFILLVAFCYLGSVLYFAMRMAWGLYRTAAIVRKAVPASFAVGEDELWGLCRRTFAVGDAVVLASREVSGPVNAGVLRNVLILPEGFAEQCMADDLLAALAHESAHMERRDFGKNLLYEFAGLLIAFHPMTRLVKARIAQTREMVCDAMATERLIGRQAYTESLLRLVTMMVPGTGRMETNAIGIFDANILEERVMRMRTKKQRVGVAMRCTVAMVSTAIFFAAAGSGTMARPVEAKGGGEASGNEIVIPLDPAVRKAAGAPNMDCTFYNDRTKPFMGTCGMKQGNAKSYTCTVNPGTDAGQAVVSQRQSGCEWKVARYRAWLKAHPVAVKK